MKRGGVTFTEKAIADMGFVEYERDKFGHKSRVQEMAKSEQKISKNGNKKPKPAHKLPKFDLFVRLCEIELGIAPVPEYRFNGNRKWRMDYAWPHQMVFLEVEGGVWSGGRHTRGKGFVADMEKYNAAAALGWRLVRCQPADIESGAALRMVREVLNA